MTDERRERILAVADELEAQGQVASNSAVYAAVMGHRGHVVEVMKARRAERAAASGGVLVAEEEGEDEDEATATEAATLAEDLRQLESAYEAWHLALERLWEVEQDGPLSEAQYGRKAWLEYQIVQNRQTKERLEGELQVARTVEAVHGGQAHHDAAIPALRTLAVQTLQEVAQLAGHLAALRDGFQAQVDPLFRFQDRHNMQAFDVQDGATYVRQLVAELFPQDPRAPAMVTLLLLTPPLEGNAQDALAGCARLKPYSQVAIDSYLKQHTEGRTNGSHS